MCRNIKQLRGSDDGPTDQQLRLAALQYVRKVTGYRQPSKANAVVFEAAVDEIAESTRNLLSHLVIRDRPVAARSGSHEHPPGAAGRSSWQG